MSEEKQTAELKTVELWGMELQLPKDKADALIRLRDEKVNGYNSALTELSAIKHKEEQARLEAAEAKRRADAVEAAKKGELENAEKLFSQKYQEELNKYKSHSFRNAVKSTLLSREDIVKSAVDDVLDQIINSYTFVLSDDFSVKTQDGKTVEEIVNSFVDARDYLKVAKGPKPQNSGSLTPTKAEPRVDPQKAWQAALSRVNNL